MKRALFICFDFGDWNNAKSWSYVSSYLLYHQLSAQTHWEVELQIVPHTYSERAVDALVVSLTKNRRFDLIFTWLPHISLSAKGAATLAQACDKLIFFLIESLCYTKSEISELPHLRDRWGQVTSLVTRQHLIVCLCPQSFRKLREHGYNARHVHGFWPSPDIVGAPRHQTPSQTFAFVASMYNTARREASRIVADISSRNGYANNEIVDSQGLVLRFNALCQELEKFDASAGSSTARSRDDICREMADVRRTIWAGFMVQLGRADFLVTLASYFKGVPGRVIEALYCEVPVVFFESNMERGDISKLSGVGGIVFADRDSLESFIQGMRPPHPIDHIDHNIFRDFREVLAECLVQSTTAESCIGQPTSNVPSHIATRPDKRMLKWIRRLF